MSLDTRPSEPVTPLLSFERVTKGYLRNSSYRGVLNRVSFQICPGEIVSILALPGQGKSTLLRLAAGVEIPDDGTVRFDGRDFGALSTHALSELLGGPIGWVQGGPPQAHVTVLDWLLDGPLERAGRHSGHSNALASLERCDVLPCATHEWETLDERERALVAIARAIAGSPRLLLIDDLALRLGIRDTDQLTRLQWKLSRESGIAILACVSHAAGALHSDRILTLGGGRLTAGPERPVAEVLDFPVPAGESSA